MNQNIGTFGHVLLLYCSLTMLIAGSTVSLGQVPQLKVEHDSLGEDQNETTMQQ